MIKMILGFLVFTGSLLCHSNDKISEKPVLGTSRNFPLQEQSAMLYIVRPNVFSGSMAKLEVSVNGAPIATMKNNSTFAYKLPATGKTFVKLEGSGLNKQLYRPVEIELLTENNKAYFVEIGWTTQIAQPIYIKQVAYEQVAAKFPELGNVTNQGSISPLQQNNTNQAQQNITNQAVNNVQNDKTAIQGKEIVNDKVPENKTVRPAAPVIISDVDKNIPVNSGKGTYLFALIIGNEDYSSFQNGLGSEVNVAYASNDAKVFKEYANKTLGVAEENTIFLLNARAIEMNRAITKMNLYAKNSNGKAELYIYYAGHGFPDEETKEPNLMPVDVSGSDLQFAVKLNDLYRKLTEFPVLKVTVFLDACFSGGGRGQGLVAARGVKIKPKETLLSGNLVVFTSSSGDQSSLAYKDEQHGMFTYFLLKKLQETKGKVSYKELSDYLSEKVGLNSIRVNEKEQNPQTIVSPQAQNIWETWRFIK
jgi:hypothetical protein